MTEKPWYVVVSGYISQDHILKIHTPARVGFTSLISNKDNTKIYYGGCPVNISYALCKLGVKAIPLLRVGDDFEDTGFKDFLEKGGVPAAGIKRVKEEVTSVCYLIQDNNGRHITFFYPGSMDGKYSCSMDDSIFSSSSMGVLTVGAYEDNKEFLLRIRKHRLPLVFGMKSDKCAFPLEFLNEVLRYSSIIFSNEEERNDIEKMFRMNLTDLFDMGSAEIIVTTMGKKGSRYYYKNNGCIESAEIPICDYGPPVDTAGSGDAYISGFLYGYCRNQPVRKCAMLGTVMSSFVIEEEGCCTGLPSEERLLERYRRFSEKIKEDI
jgi:adenosine kinase